MGDTNHEIGRSLGMRAKHHDHIVKDTSFQKGLTPVPNASKSGTYECPRCDQRFTESRSVNRHLRGSCKNNNVQGGNYFCDLCESVFSRNDILQRHFQEIHLLLGNAKRLSRTGKALSNMLYNEHSEDQTDLLALEVSAADEPLQNFQIAEETGPTSADDTEGCNQNQKAFHSGARIDKPYDNAQADEVRVQSSQAAPQSYSIAACDPRSICNEDLPTAIAHTATGATSQTETFENRARKGSASSIDFDEWLGFD